jgi:hypothetical protein
MNRSKIFGALFGVAALAILILQPVHAAAIAGFDDIENWTGSGANQSALIIQWNFTDGVNTTSYSFAWGYRWDEGGTTPTGWDLLTSVSSADPWLEIMPLSDYAGYETFTDAVFGIFYTPDGQASLASAGAPGIPFYLPGGPTADTPGATAGTGGLYQNGWADSYWSYNLSKNPSELYPGTDGADWTYSLSGATGRELTNNSWDIWSFDVEFISPAFVTPVSAVPEPGAIGLLGFALALTCSFRRRSLS